jgi:hypothetical protein
MVWRLEVERCASAMFIMPGLSGMARRGLGDERDMMESHGAEALSGIMVALIGMTKIIPIFILKIS